MVQSREEINAKARARYAKRKALKTKVPIPQINILKDAMEADAIIAAFERPSFEDIKRMRNAGKTAALKARQKRSEAKFDASLLREFNRRKALKTAKQAKQVKKPTKAAVDKTTAARITRLESQIKKIHTSTGPKKTRNGK